MNSNKILSMMETLMMKIGKGEKTSPMADSPIVDLDFPLPIVSEEALKNFEERSRDNKFRKHFVSIDLF